jgi:phosphotransferase system HPr (HPr) family protein
LHLRAASRIVHAAKRFQSDIRIVYDGVETNAKSILGLASLVARHHEPVELIVDGPDQDEAMAFMVELIEVGLAKES